LQYYQSDIDFIRIDDDDDDDDDWSSTNVNDVDDVMA
jgi:hypothetical protein